MFNLPWYYTLNRPPLTPPAWVFSPVWAILYLTIFVSLVIFALKPYSGSKNWGFFVFFLQLFINLCWPFAFFGLQNLGLALALIVILDILVLVNIIEFLKITLTGGILLVPYLLWLLYATYLNVGYFVLN